MNDIVILNQAATSINKKILWSRPYISTGDFAQVPDWDPLTDDSAALELAIGLGMYDCVGENGTLRTWSGEMSEEARKNTRRAIVEASAKIGRNKEQF